MPNPIKFSTQSSSNSLRKGNASIGVQKKSFGPSSSTGFWNGINPPANGFVVYQERTPQQYSLYGPSIAVLLNEDSLINFVRVSGGTNINNRADSLEWLASQDNLFCIKSPYSSQVTENIILYLDSSAVESYPEKGVTWYDLSPSDYNGSLINGPEFSPSFSGVINFDGIDDYVLMPNSIGSDLSSNLTFSITAKRNGDSSSSIGGLIGNLWHTEFTGVSIYFRNNNTQIDVQTADGSTRTSYTLTSPVSNLLWTNYTLTVNNGVVSVYVNGVLLDSRSRSIKQNPSRPVVLAKWAQSFNSYYLNGSIQCATVYSRSLTTEEILENYYQSQIQTSGLSMVVDPYNVISNNDLTTITDLTANKYIFTYENSVERSTDFGGSLRLNTGRIYRNSISWYGNYTFGFWVKMEGEIQSGMFYSESNRGTSGCSRVYSSMNSNGTFSYRVWDNSSQAAGIGGARTITTTSNVQNGEWNFITCVWSNGSSNRTRGLYVFVNGILESSIDMIGNDGSYASLQLGGVTGCLGTTAFNCYLGPFMQYSNLAMSNDQVLSLYSAYQMRYR